MPYGDEGIISSRIAAQDAKRDAIENEVTNVHSFRLLESLRTGHKVAAAIKNGWCATLSLTGEGTT